VQGRVLANYRHEKGSLQETGGSTRDTYKHTHTIPITATAAT